MSEMAKAEQAAKMSRQSSNAFLITTGHVHSAHKIKDFILAYAKNRKDGGRGSRNLLDGPDNQARAGPGPDRDLKAIAEVGSAHEVTNAQVLQSDKIEVRDGSEPVDVQSRPQLPSSGGVPLSGSVELDQAANQDDSSVQHDQDWRNLR